MCGTGVTRSVLDGRINTHGSTVSASVVDFLFASEHREVSVSQEDQESGITTLLDEYLASRSRLAHCN